MHYYAGRIFEPLQLTVIPYATSNVSALCLPRDPPESANLLYQCPVDKA